MAASRAGVFTHRALPIGLAVLAFVCGGLVVAWKVERDRDDCWREMAEDGVSSSAPCA